MKKPPSRLKRIVREAQLVTAVGVVVLVIYAMIVSTIVLHVNLPTVESPLLGLLMSALVTQAPLLLLAPGVCYVTALLTDLRPQKLAFGSMAIVEAMLFLLRFVTGGLQSDSVVPLALAVELAIAGTAAVLALLATRAAAARVARTTELEPALALAGAPAAAPVESFAEQMRRAQESNRPQPVAEPAPEATPAASEPSKD